MSDEESFVILGTSPMPSLERDGDKVDVGTDVSIQSDTPGSCFSSLKNSQLKELQNARQVSPKTTPTSSLTVSNEVAGIARQASPKTTPTSSLTVSNEVAGIARQASPKTTPTSSLTASNEVAGTSINVASVTAAPSMQRSAESILWSKPQVEVHDDDFLPISLEDCAVQSPLEQSPKTSMHSKTPQTSLNRSLNQNNNKENQQPSMNSNKNMTTSQNVQTSSSKNSSLASSFIMGDVNADILKSSVYSQFPSISMQSSAEDVVKLQTMVTEYVQLKATLEKVNNTMKMFYTNSLEWKEKMNDMEKHYKDQLNDCQKQIENLRIENQELKKCIEDQVEQTKAVDLARQNDREDMIKTISEKTALVENMRAQIVKLEKQQTASFEFIPKKSEDKAENNFDNIYITRGEHEHIVKDLKRQLSELLASNLDLMDVEKRYIDELNCLKVNMTAAEELINQNRAEIAVLQASDANKQMKIQELETANSLLVTDNSELNERISLLEQQNEVHRKDFEMERESRQTAMGEKLQVIQDLRALQKRNQELLEDRQKLVESYERRVSTASSVIGGSTPAGSLAAAAAAAQSYINNPQRPIKELTPPSPTSQSVPAPVGFNCPVCHKGFKSLSVLQSHVNDCIDRH